MEDNKVNQIAGALLKDPLSEKWRAEYAKLSAEDREDVRFIIDSSAMGTGIPGEKFMDFWKFAEEIDK